MGFDVSGLTAYVNGEYVPGTAAAVSIFDHGFMYGDGVFEGMRVFDGGLFRARDHMARFVRSARAVGLAPPDARSCGAAICTTRTCARSSRAGSAARGSTRAAARRSR
jgi:branched-subunit amino acid aminotransferase/4-amino-4-deoxychorismate lyase